MTVTNHHSLRTIQDLGPGDHLCCLYETEEEHRAVLTPFLRQGLERGEKVLYIVDARSADTVLGYLRDDGLDVESYLDRGQLAILTADEAYVREGVFDPDGMIAMLGAETGRALAEGYAALRFTGEMTWALGGPPGSERLIEYEAKLNELPAGSNCLALCQYDRRAFAPELLLDVLSTHPIVLVGATVYDNFYYVAPREFLGSERPAAQLRRRLQNLAERNRSEEALREAEAFHRSLLEAIPDMMFRLKRDGTYVEFVPAERLEPYVPPSEILGKTVSELLPPQLAREMMRSVDAALQSGQTQRFGYDLEVKDEQRYYEARIVATAEDEVLVIVRDFTAQKRLEEEAARRQAREELEGKAERQMLGRNPYGLTFREFTVLNLVAGGAADKEIADLLGISIFTVNKHVSNVLAKMGAASRTEAGVRGVREGLLS